MALKRHHGRQAMVTSPPDDGPRHRRYSARYQARLDAALSAKLEDLARTVHRTRGAVLRGGMQWGLAQTKGWSIDRSTVVAVSPVPVLLEPDLLQHMQDTAAAHRVSVAAWLREAMRRVTTDDFPASWRVVETTGRSHESGYFRRKFGIRLDAATSQKLETLTHTFGRSAAGVIRQLIAEETSEDFPESWHLAVNERRTVLEGVER
jgi:predicted DNA-binding protein